MTGPIDIGTVEQIALGDLRTRWVDTGSGREGTVLVLHSIGLHAGAYERLRESLGDDWRVCAYDQRGHREARAVQTFDLDDLVADALHALARIDATRVHLLGHSFGGVIAALAAVRAPERAASLSMIATPAAGMPMLLDRARETEGQRLQEVIDGTLTRWFSGEPDDHNTQVCRSIAARCLQQTTPAALASMWRALASFPGFSGLRERIPEPLCVAAAGDASTPPTMMQKIVDDVSASAAKPARLEVIAGAGHMVPLTRPAEVAGLLARHWKGLP